MFDWLVNGWYLFFGWMPNTLAIICTVLIGILVVIIIIKIIAFIIDAIPFL